VGSAEWVAVQGGSHYPSADVEVWATVRRGLVAEVLLHRDETADVRLWTRPGGESVLDSDGVAVLSDSGFPHALARIPLCGCGDRGCGNAGLQLDAQVDAATLLDVLELARDLHWDSRPARREQQVWQPPPGWRRW